MVVHLQSIKSSLERFGWKLADARVIANLWVAEIWLIELTWTPIGLRVYLTFEIDGEADARDVSSVWAATASLGTPDDWFVENAASSFDSDEGIDSSTLSIAKERDIEPFFQG